MGIRPRHLSDGIPVFLTPIWNADCREMDLCSRRLPPNPNRMGLRGRSRLGSPVVWRPSKFVGPGIPAPRCSCMRSWISPSRLPPFNFTSLCCWEFSGRTGIGYESRNNESIINGVKPPRSMQWRWPRNAGCHSVPSGTLKARGAQQ